MLFAANCEYCDQKRRPPRSKMSLNSIACRAVLTRNAGLTADLRLAVHQTSVCLSRAVARMNPATAARPEDVRRRADELSKQLNYPFGSTASPWGHSSNSLRSI